VTTTTIPVQVETREKLKRYGMKGDTYDSILRRMMAEVDHLRFMERQYARLEEKEKFVPLEEV
jgi:hypothetical protein